MPKRTARKQSRKAKPLEPDAVILVDENTKAYLRTDLPLTPECHVALVYERRKPQLGIYWPGPPARFADYKPFDERPLSKLRKRKLPVGAKVYRWIESVRRFPPRP